MIAQTLNEEKTILIPPSEANWWADYYHTFFGIESVFDGLFVCQELYFPRFYVVVHEEVGSDPSRIFRSIKGDKYEKKHFPCWSEFEDLNQIFPRHDRGNLGTYAFVAKDESNATFGVSNLRCDQALASSYDTIQNLAERLLFGHSYFLRTGVQLDSQVINPCAGSRSLDGKIFPRVYYDATCGLVCVSRHHLESANSGIRYRQVFFV